MTDTVATPPASPISSGTSLNGSSAKKFDGEGLPFKAKLIGMEDLSIDRDEKICLDSMFKLKAVVRARGEHKQRIQLNLTMSAVNIIDDTTKAQIATHAIERISFVVIDPRDTRAFGYIYNTSDDRHQFWAIKTERVAAATVLALKELFELAFEQFTNAEKTKGEDTKSPATSPSTVAPPVLTVPTLEQPQVTPISSPPPTQPAPVPTPAPPSLFDDGIWGESTAAVITQKSAPVESLWDMNEPVVPVAQPPPRSVDPLEDLFADFSLTAPATQPPASTSTTNSLLGAFSNPVPPPVPTNQYANFYAQPPPPQTNLFNPTSTLLQQQQRPSTPTTMLLLPQQPPQQNLLSPIALSPVAPPSVTSPFAGLDLFVDLSTTTTVKTTKDSFFPNTAPKTMQQLLLEKQRNPFSRP